MQALIKISTVNNKGNQIQVVDARELHAILESQRNFGNWIKQRIESYDFEEGKDFLTNLLKSTGGRPKKEYSLTLNMAKELAMIENNEAGKTARKYFIECERQLKQKQPLQPLSMAEMQLLVMQDLQNTVAKQKAELQQKTEVIEHQTKVIHIQAPKAIYHDKVLSSKDTVTASQLAKQLGMKSACKMNRWLNDENVIFKQNEQWLPYAEFAEHNLTKVNVHTFKHKDGSEGTSHTTVWTEKGVQFCFILLNEGIKAAKKYLKAGLQLQKI